VTVERVKVLKDFLKGGIALDACVLSLSLQIIA
jgi:hypothetical protein